MDWFKHDINAHEDIKIRKLKRMHGMAAYGVYWELVELMYSKGGSLPEGSILDEIMLMGIQEDDAQDMMESFLDLELFRCNGGSWTSDRIEAEISTANSYKERMRELGRKGAEKRYSARQADGIASAKRTPSARYSEKRGDKKENRYDNVSRDYQVEDSSFTEKFKSDKTDIVCTEVVEPTTPCPSPAVISLLLITGEEYPVTQADVDRYQAAFPGVDVMQELREMQLWCKEKKHSRQRKTERGVHTFIRNWLSSEQDRIRRIPQGSKETIRNSSVEMSLTADGSNPDAYKNERFEDYD